MYCYITTSSHPAGASGAEFSLSTSSSSSEAMATKDNAEICCCRVNFGFFSLGAVASAAASAAAFAAAASASALRFWPRRAFAEAAPSASKLRSYAVFYSAVFPTCAYYHLDNLKTTSLDLHIPQHKQQMKSNSIQ